MNGRNAGACGLCVLLVLAALEPFNGVHHVSTIAIPSSAPRGQALCRGGGGAKGPLKLALRGGSAAAVRAAIDNADSESDRERLDRGDGDGSLLRNIDIEALLKDCEGTTSWEKLKNFIGSIQDTHGEEEIDNIDVDEYGPHLRCNNTWRVGPFASKCFEVPWRERKIVGTITFPNGFESTLREGDLPNRIPFVPDDEGDTRLSTPAGADGTGRPQCSLMRKHREDLRDYDIAERDWLFNDEAPEDMDKRGTHSSVPVLSSSGGGGRSLSNMRDDASKLQCEAPVPPQAKGGLKDLRTFPHWVNEFETNESRAMPAGGYPLEFENISRQEWVDALRPRQGDGEDSSSSSHIYEHIRGAVLEEYGQAAVERVARIDKLVNRTGAEPPLPEPPKHKGMLVPRFHPDGSLEAFLPWEPDHLDEPLQGLPVERLHEKLWQYARDGRANASACLLRAGASANAVNEYTHTALHFAAMYGWTQVVEVLLEHGADVNVANDAEMTPLHYAAYHNHTPAVWSLLRGGANASLVNMFDLTAEEIAECHEDEVLVELFRAWREGGETMRAWQAEYGEELAQAHPPLNYNSRITHAQPRYCEWSEINGEFASHEEEDSMDELLQAKGYRSLGAETFRTDVDGNATGFKVSPHTFKYGAGYKGAADVREQLLQLQSSSPWEGGLHKDEELFGDDIW